MVKLYMKKKNNIYYLFLGYDDLLEYDIYIQIHYYIVNKLNINRLGSTK